MKPAALNHIFATAVIATKKTEYFLHWSEDERNPNRLN